MIGLWPFVVIGLFSGSIYALASMGVVLTYKTSGIFNFAFGGVAMFCAYSFWQLRDGWHLHQWVALPVLFLVVAPLVGLALERVYRPLVAVSAEVQIVVGLGLLGFLQALVPLVFGARDRALPSIFPTGTFGVGSHLHVGWDQLATLVLTAALALGLWGLLHRTRLGTDTRAVIDNRDLAELTGVSADRISRAAWVVSTAFAALTGILLSSTQGLDVYVLVIVVIYAFAPAVLARLVSLPVAYAGALALGVAQSVLGRWGGSGNVADLEAALPYLMLLAVLVVYGRRLREVRAAFDRRPDGTTVVAGTARRSVAGGSALVAVGVALPVLLSGPHLADVSLGLVIATVALTLVVLTGWAGQISLAQFSFVGVGAFAVGHLAGANGADFFPAMLGGAAVALVLGVLVGLPSLRLSGLYLALATMALALVLDTLVFSRAAISGGYTGLAIVRPSLWGFSFASTDRLYYLVLGVFTLFAGLAAVLRRGPVGRRLQAMRDSPMAASTLGINLATTKVCTFAACGAAAAVAGALFGAVRQTVSPSDFAFSASLELLLLVVLGGRALVSGALVAGAIFAVQLLPIPAGIGRALPLAVALAVILLAREPEGIVAVVRAGLSGLLPTSRPPARSSSDGAPSLAPRPLPPVLATEGPRG